MIKKVRARGNRTCKMCKDKIFKGQCCFETRGSGPYASSVCSHCVKLEFNKEVL